MKLWFKQTINGNKYQSKVSKQVQSQYLNYLIDPSFQGVNKPFVLSFEDNRARAGYTRYFLPKVKIKLSQKEQP